MRFRINPTDGTGYFFAEDSKLKSQEPKVPLSMGEKIATGIFLSVAVPMVAIAGTLYFLASPVLCGITAIFKSISYAKSKFVFQGIIKKETDNKDVVESLYKIKHLRAEKELTWLAIGIIPVIGHLQLIYSIAFDNQPDNNLAPLIAKYNACLKKRMASIDAQYTNKTDQQISQIAQQSMKSDSNNEKEATSIAVKFLRENKDGKSNLVKILLKHWAESSDKLIDPKLYKSHIRVITPQSEEDVPSILNFPN